MVTEFSTGFFHKSGGKRETGRLGAANSIDASDLSADEGKKKKNFLAVGETRRSSWLAPRAGFSLEKLEIGGGRTGRQDEHGTPSVRG